MDSIFQLLEIHTKKIQKVLFILLLSVLSIHFIRMAFIAEGVLEPGDGISHYTIAKNAPQYPELYLDHWGKPLFTLLSSPFAQLGFEGMIIFNVLLFILTSFFLFKWGFDRLNPFAWTTPLLLLSSHVYFEMVNAGMTEILFATLLTATIHLYLSKKFVTGSILFSFSLFSRPEAILIIPCLALYLVWKKQYKAIPLLSFGFIIYSIVGYFYFKDFLWYIHNNPYPASVPFYGKGEFLSFFKSNQAIWGPFMTLFSVMGVIVLLVSIFGPKRKKAIEYTLLLIVPAATVLLVHSYIWWKGIHGSLGLTRVISTVIPLFVMISLLFINYIHKVIKQTVLIQEKYKPLISFFFSITLGILLYTKNIKFSILPVQETAMQQTLSEAANWYVSQNFTKKTYYMDPYFAFKAGLNPYETTKTGSMYAIDKENPALNLQQNDIIIWDSHFSPNDGGVSKEKIIQSPQLEIIKTFNSRDPNSRTNGNTYEIIISVVK